MALIQIRHISKKFSIGSQIVQALDDVSLDIYEGETIALLGANGAGKTTLSAIIATLHPPTSGDILYSGKSIYNNLSLYRSYLGYCPQRPNLDYALSVKENLLFAARYFLVPVEKITERVNSLMHDFDLARYAHYNAKQLSGGYRQRLLIARALVHNPRIIIFDEPTIALDPFIRKQLWANIKNLKSRGITIILTTHYLDEAEILSDRVCILDKGRVLLIDKTESLKKQYDKTSLEDVFLHLIQSSSLNE